MKSVCLITPGHISTNPRLVKEAMALSQAGFNVHVIFTQYVAGQVAFDVQILDANPNWTCDILDWTGLSPKSKANRLASKFRMAISKNGYVKLNRNLAWQIKKAVTQRADLYLAHNLGALPIVIQAAKKSGTLAGFDAEDFHRNETSDDVNSVEVKLKIAIEDKYIPQLDHFTAASPLILERYQNLYKIECASILNAFPKVASAQTNDGSALPLKLFWFSQTVGPKRGLEVIIKAINLTGVKMQLNLLGQQTIQYNEDLLSLANASICEIIFRDTIAPNQVFELAKTFDIGLAAEPREPLNRDICLTNKLFTYIQCGLAVAASDTQAQTDFIDKHPETGKLYTNEIELSAILLAHHDNRAALKTTKQRSFNLGQNELNWETESVKFISLIKSTLGIS